MKCPLLAPTPAETSLGELWKAVDCLEEECAWWSPLSDCCCIRDLPGILIALGNVVGKIHDVINSRMRQ